MDNTSNWQRIKSFIDERQHLIITTHISPDGDALGSEIALALVLKHLGKTCQIMNSSNTSQNYKFLDSDNQIILYRANKHLEDLSNSDGVFILDISDWLRLREIGKAIHQLNLPRVCIDHHQPTDKMAPIEVIAPEASCTGELLYDFFQFIEVPITIPIAEALYTCLLTDTGSFRFSNTSPRVHQITADLLAYGVNARKIYENVYESCSPAKVKLMGEVMRQLNYECDGKLAWFDITRQKLHETGAETWELETFPEIPKMIAGVEVGLMFTEIDKNRTKISLRSKGRIPIIDVAEKYGGGGHKFAAGAVLPKSLKAVMHEVVSETSKIVLSYTSN